MNKSLRSRVLECSIYISGNTFTTSDVLRRIDCETKMLSGALTSMIERGELVVTKKNGNSTTYQRPIKGLLRQAWVPASNYEQRRAAKGCRR